MSVLLCYHFVIVFVAVVLRLVTINCVRKGHCVLCGPWNMNWLVSSWPAPLAWPMWQAIDYKIGTYTHPWLSYHIGYFWEFSRNSPGSIIKQSCGGSDQPGSVTGTATSHTRYSVVITVVVFSCLPWYGKTRIHTFPLLCLDSMLFNHTLYLYSRFSSPCYF